jgi:hypothetical protein
MPIQRWRSQPEQQVVAIAQRGNSLDIESLRTSVERQAVMLADRIGVSQRLTQAPGQFRRFAQPASSVHSKPGEQMGGAATGVVLPPQE